MAETTAAVEFGAAAMEVRKRDLVIDLIAQSERLMTLGHDAARLEPQLAEALYKRSLELWERAITQR